MEDVMTKLSKLKQYCTFYLDGHYFGINVLDVQEVFRFQEMTNIPMAPKVARGLINLRGQIILAVDLRLRLGLPDTQEDLIPMNVVVRTEGGEVVSFLVDAIGDVMEVSDEKFETPPDTLSPTMRELISGVYKLEKELLLILNIEKAIVLDAVA